MKERISHKLEQVKENQNQLEQHLKNHADPVIEKRKEIVQLGIEELLQKLQNGDLNCLEVLRAYQAKVITSTSIVFTGKLITLSGPGCNKRIKLCHRIHQRSRGIVKVRINVSVYTLYVKAIAMHIYSEMGTGTGR